MASAVSPNPVGERTVRNTDYYLQGGDVVFRVENNLFRVHRYFFTRDSAFFRERLPHPPPPGEFTKGSSDNNPFVLEDTSKVDFERLLWVFYNPKYSIYDGSVEEWSSILKLAHQWEFVEVKAFALRELEQLEMPALQKIILYHTHDINRNLLLEAYCALTLRDESITIEEGRQLGLETALMLAHAREVARAPVFNSKKSGNPNSPVNLAGNELDTLIKNLFHLSLPDATTERPSTPQTPRRGTTTGGRSTPQLDIHINGTGSPSSNSYRGGSVPPTGSTATQMEPPMARSTAARAANKAAPTPSPGPRPTQDAGAMGHVHERAGREAEVSNEPETKGKGAAAAEVVSDSHWSEPVAEQKRANIVETKKTIQAQGAPSASKTIVDKKGQGPARKSETVEQGSGTARPERARTQSEQLASTKPLQQASSDRSRSRTAEPTKKEQLKINTDSRPPKRDTTPTPTRESASSSTLPPHRPTQHKKQSASTPAATGGLFGFVSNFIGGSSGDPGYESSSRESEDDTPMAGAWRSRDSKSRQERERAEAEARAQAQEATRQRLEAEAKERAEAEAAAQALAEAEAAAKAHAEAEAAAKALADAEAAKAHAEAEAAAKARADAEEKARKEEAEAARVKRVMEAREAKKAAKREADAKAKAAKAEAEAEAEAERRTREADAKEKADADAAALKAKQEAEAKAQAEAKEEAEIKAKADAEAKAKADEEAEREKERAAEAKAIADADAKAKAAEDEKAEQDALAQAAAAAQAEEAKKEEERKRLRREKEKEAAELRERLAEEKIKKQRAADKAARTNATVFSPMSPSQTSGVGWGNVFSKFSQATSGLVSTIVAPTDELRSPSKLTSTGSSNPWAKRQGKSGASPIAELSPRLSPILRLSTANPTRVPASSPSATSGTPAGSSLSVVSAGTTLVSQELNTNKDEQEGAAGEGKGDQAQAAAVNVPVPPAEQVAGNETNETKTQPTEVTADKQPNPDEVKTTAAASGEPVQSSPPDAPGETSTTTNSAPTPSDADTTQAVQAASAKADAKPESSEDPSPPLPTPADTSAPPPVPAKNATDAKDPASTSEETPVSPPQTAEPAASKPVEAEADKSDETSTPPKEEAATAGKGDGSEPEAVAKDHTPQPSTNEGSTPAQGGDSKLDGAARPVLRLDRVRELSTASVMSSSSLETPADEAGSSAVDMDDEADAPDAPESASPQTGKAKKKKKPKKKKGEKNSLRPPSGAAVNNVDNSTVQEIKPVATPPVDVPSGEGEGELVEKVVSGDEDPPVIVETPQAGAEKTVDASGSGSDDWSFA